MSIASFMAGLLPNRLIGSLGSRGIKGTALHAMRRTGTMAGRAMAGPQTIRINPMGAVCNHKCPMCWLQHLTTEQYKQVREDDLKTGMKAADYEALFDSMPAGLLEVNVVGGGEPLIHREIIDIFRSIRSHGFRGSLITNASLLTKEIAAQMIDMEWNVVRASVHAGDSETYKAVQGVDRFEKVRANLGHYDRLRREAGKRSNCRMLVFHVLQHENIHDIEPLFAFADSVGADSMVLEKIIPLDEEKWLAPEEIREAHDQIVECSKRYRTPFNKHIILDQLSREASAVQQDGRPWKPAARCSVGFDQAFFTSTGDVLPCCFSNEKFGNIREQPFNEIWNGDAYSEFRRNLIAGRFRDYCVTSRCHLVDVLHD